MLKPTISLFLTTVCTVLGQSNAVTGLAFEVATIKPVKVVAGQPFGTGRQVDVQVDREDVRIGPMDLNRLIRTAYAVPARQFVPSASMRENFNLFEIVAKLPPNGTANQVLVMLQTLLAERFELKIRRETAEADTFSLIRQPGAKVGSGSTDSSEAKGDPEHLTIGESSMKVDRDGQYVMKINDFTLSTNADGVAHFEASSVAALTKFLSPLPFPVVDKTGITSPVKLAMDIYPPGNGVEMIKAVEKLGFKLVREKNPLERIIVESVRQMPTEN